MAGASDPQRHVVVLDCNVYLDVARVLGAPFSWSKLDAAVAQMVREPLPHPGGQMYDSIRVIAMMTSGRFAGEEPVEVWTNDHISDMVFRKAIASTTPDPVTGAHGLGWTEQEAESLVTDLVEGLASRSGGGTIPDWHVPDGNPPLDHEDGMVFGACRNLAGVDPLANVYCVTRDRGFLEAAAEGRLTNHSRVLTPAQLVGVMRAARFQRSGMGRGPTFGRV